MDLYNFTKFHKQIVTKLAIAHFSQVATPPAGGFFVGLRPNGIKLRKSYCITKARPWKKEPVTFFIIDHS